MRRGREEAAENGGSAGEEGGRLARGAVLFSMEEERTNRGNDLGFVC